MIKENNYCWHCGELLNSANSIIYDGKVVIDDILEDGFIPCCDKCYQEYINYRQKTKINSLDDYFKMFQVFWINRPNFNKTSSELVTISNSSNFGFDSQVNELLSKGYKVLNTFCGLHHCEDGTTKQSFKAILLKED